jgi:hypothetical protein
LGSCPLSLMGAGSFAPHAHPHSFKRFASSTPKLSNIIDLIGSLKPFRSSTAFRCSLRPIRAIMLNSPAIPDPLSHAFQNRDCIKAVQGTPLLFVFPTRPLVTLTVFRGKPCPLAIGVVAACLLTLFLKFLLVCIFPPFFPKMS